MKQVLPIEEILAEFRKKYGEEGSGVKEVTEGSAKSEDTATYDSRSEQSEIPVFYQRKKSQVTFLRLILTQGAIAIAIIALLVAVKLSNSELYGYITKELSKALSSQL